MKYFKSGLYPVCPLFTCFGGKTRSPKAIFSGILTVFTIIPNCWIGSTLRKIVGQESTVEKGYAFMATAVSYSVIEYNNSSPILKTALVGNTRLTIDLTNNCQNK